MELTELIAALVDENGQIRWLAGASLVKTGGRLLAACLGTQPGEVAQGEVRKGWGNGRYSSSFVSNRGSPSVPRSAFFVVASTT